MSQIQRYADFISKNTASSIHEKSLTDSEIEELIDKGEDAVNVSLMTKTEMMKNERLLRVLVISAFFRIES